MYKIIRAVILFTIFIGINACDAPKSEKKQEILVNVLPYPNKVLNRGGNITITNKNWVIANVSDSVSSELATYLVKSLKKITGEDALITDLYSTRKHPQSIKLELVRNASLRTNESYTLEITSPHIKIKARSAQGIYYGIQTLLQLLKSGKEGNNYTLAKIVIKDTPAFLVRGITLKQSQINIIEPASLFRQLGALKINSIFIINDTTPHPEQNKSASENYIKLNNVKELPNDITLISFGTQAKDLQEFYKSIEVADGTGGVVLDLSSTSIDDIGTKVFMLAELAWTEKKNHDYARLQTYTKAVNQ